MALMAHNDTHIKIFLNLILLSLYFSCPVAEEMLFTGSLRIFKRAYQAHKNLG